MIQSQKIKTISNQTIKDGSDDKRKIPPGLFKPHMTWMISGKTGSGKSTALIRMLKAYCDSGVFQKVILISPTAAYDAKYKMLPLTEVHEEYSDELINQIMVFAVATCVGGLLLTSLGPGRACGTIAPACACRCLDLILVASHGNLSGI